MNNLPKLIRCFTGILLLSFVLLVFANFAILAFLVAWQSPSVADSPYNVAIQAGKAFQISESGYILQEDISTQLKEQDIWAFVVDNDTLQIVWKTENVPDTIPASYSLSDIADLSVGISMGILLIRAKQKMALSFLDIPKTAFGNIQGRVGTITFLPTYHKLFSLFLLSILQLSY